MKPILFSASETAFTSNGLGRLDPTSCVVTEERNGQYELECIVPVDSPHFADIENNMILGVIPGDGMTLQAFRIYQITEPLNGLVTLSARHLSYDLSYNTVMPFTAGSVTAALLGLKTYSVETNPFTMWTDKTTAASFKVSVPQTFRSLLGGQRGSILDVYGGEYQFDNWTVKLYNQRGSDTNVTLRYGKNITDINQEQNLESVVTGIVPYWADDEHLVTLPEKSVDSAYASSYPYKRTVPIDFSSEWQDPPTEQQLRTRAQNYITANNIGVPKVSIKVSFVALWQTEEFKNVAPLERVHLCDTVGVVFEKYGINARAKVIKTEWDCLAERYRSIELGEARSNFASTLVTMNDQTENEIVETKTFLQNAIDAATSIITGNNGGYLKINSNADGQPYELLIMDTDDITTATKVWRWNMGGLGYSSNGYQGPFGIAIDMSGRIVADYVATGKLDASIIQVGTLADFAGNFSLDMVTGDLTMNAGTFKGLLQGGTIQGGTIGIGGVNNDQFAVDSNGNVTIKAGSINLGWDSGNNRYNFSVNSNGVLTAHSGNFDGTISGSTISGSTITSSKTVSGVTKTTTIQDGTITTNDLQATSGTFSGTVSGGAISGGTMNATAITGGTISGSTISGGTVQTGGDSGSKLVLSGGEILGYYNNSQKGKINMVNGGIRLGEPGSIFDSYIDLLDENCINIGANVLKINGVAAYSGTFKDKDNRTVTVTNGLITEIF